MRSDSFADRYLLARFNDGGVVVDLETGNYFRVDAIAAEVCAVLAKSDGPGAIDELAGRLEISPAHATSALSETRSALAAIPTRGTPTGPYHFHPEEGGFGLWHAGKRVLGVTGDNLEIHLPPGHGIERNPLLELYVRALAPKVMFLRGIAVIHASACATANALVAFAGQSGAGKTTTVRAFVRAGARPITEDLLVLKGGTARPSVVLGSEVRVHAWARKTSNALAAGARQMSSTELASMADGAAEPIDVLHFLEVTRRSGSEFAVRLLEGSEALLSLMANHFLGDSSRAGWRRFFGVAQWIISALRLVEVTAPAGLEALNAAAGSYMSTWTSYVSVGATPPPNQA